MSIRVMSWVWDNSASRGIDRLVLLAIADHASDDGSNAYPSTRTLASKTGVHMRTVQTSVRRLIALGELTVQPNAGQHGVNVYRVPMTDAPTAEDHPGATPPRRYAVPKEGDTGAQTPGPPPPRSSATPVETAPAYGAAPPEPSLTTKPKKTTSSLDARGSRIDPSWRPDQELIDVMRSEGVLDDMARRELRKFIDYWLAQPGARGRRSDWPATWRNWLRRAMESPPARGQPGTALAPAGPAVMHPRTADALTVAERLRATENAS